MLDRLCGTETEYAIRFRPKLGSPHPGNEALFEAIRGALNELVRTRRAEGPIASLQHRVFTENGGSVYYEFLPHAVEGGLVEACTPECRGPAQLLRYQRAQDRLLTQATEIAARRMARTGELGLLKNCRDAEGNVYGAQESYEAPVAAGFGLLVWRFAVLACLPWAVIAGVVYWALVALLLILALPGLLIVSVVAIGEGVFGAAGTASGTLRLLQVVARFLGWLETFMGVVLMAPCSLTIGLAFRAVGFREHRRGGLGFLVSRSVISGAGTRLEGGQWALAEKAGTIRRLARWLPWPSDRGLLEIGHLLKPYLAVVLGQFHGVARLLAPRQRLQIGLSDSNCCEVADYLKLATTCLVLDMAEAGALRDAPRPRDAAAAARTLSGDPALQASVPLVGGGAATAMELQWFYANRAAQWLDEVAAPVEAHQLVRRWRATLSALEHDRSTLVGVVDWVTKRALVDEVGDPDPDVQKKVDLRYHELGANGYATWLAEAGLLETLVSADDAEAAIHEPPQDTPARERGRLVRALANAGTDARVGWTRVKVRSGLGRVIKLRRHEDPP